MKTFKLLPIYAMMMAASSATDSFAQSAGINYSNLDTTAATPGKDFYQFATGGWMKNNPLPDEYARFGTFDLLAENNRKQMKELITELASKSQPLGSVAFKIATLYNQVMDSTTQNNQGVAPLKEDLDKINNLKKVQQIPSLMSELQSEGVDAYFSIYVDADPMNSDVNLVQTYQSGLGLGNRDYYLENDSNTVRIRKEYMKHIMKMFSFFGYEDKESLLAVDAIMEIETRIARASFSKEHLRDPYANYHKMSIDTLLKNYPSFDWLTYFRGFKIHVNELSVSQEEPIRECLDIIAKTPLKKQKYYLTWCLINEAATSLGDQLYNQNFEFYGKVLSGTQVPQPRWKRAVGLVNSSLGEAVGQMYVKKYFPRENKDRMVMLVHNLQDAYAQRIAGLTWMNDTTKAKAIDKLKAFRVKIGYPDRWRDYTGLMVNGASLWQNRKNISKFNTDFMMSKASKPVDRDEWYMTPQTVNAYYNPSTNEICFPAGILQAPFFDMKADDAFNYGAIGVVIGHEMTHGFDDQGRQFDKMGNLADWWTADDATDFKAKAKVMSDFFNNIEVAPGVHANGEFTLGENLADHGGLQISFQAYKKASEHLKLKTENGFTPDQRFFLAYAAVWAANIRPEEILRRTKMDPHALGRWRVNGALPHIGAWYDAFNITPEDPLYVKPENRVSIW